MKKLEMSPAATVGRRVAPMSWASGLASASASDSESASDSASASALGLAWALALALASVLTILTPHTARGEEVPENQRAESGVTQAPVSEGTESRVSGGAKPDSGLGKDQPGQSEAERARKPPPGFEPIRAAEEQVDANLLVIIAYASFFVLMFGYVVVMAKKQSEVAKEMTELANRLATLEKER